MNKTTFRSVHSPIIPLHKNKSNSPKPTGQIGISFSNQLNQEIQKQVQQKPLTFSKHATIRMDQRNISIDVEMQRKIEEKLLEAKNKGVNDSLVLLHNAALIINAKNNTVITAMDRNEAASQIFTNINGTILID
ncbi:TIGR02530 family flagellar biosynthesis protein [Peribacillus alkalitolerans]|uniref:TIGR02530 family flagellar biosynthesis protein n=1 Tax=Peribacillus alkalitolerans TaxID=1550385 RepID=UPI0013D4A2AF|nr:TIGR02530 family flagellar biosynthesis protein [Peribacillus alkalitolerans]